MGEFTIPTPFEDIADGYAILPDGDYSFEVLEAEQRKAQGSANQRLFLNLKVISEGEFKGSSVPFGVTLVEESMWVFKRLLKSIVPADKIEKVSGKKFNTESFVSKKFDAHSVQRTYTNPETKKVTVSNDLSNISRLGALTSGKPAASETVSKGEAPAESW